MPVAFGRKILISFATAYVLYLALVAIVLVPAVNGVLPRLFHEQTGRTLQFADMTFNPFTLAIDLHQVRNDNPDGSLFIAAETLHANLSLSSLWRGPTLDALAIRGLQLQISQTAPERYNFADILAHRQAMMPAPEEESSTPPAIDIADLHLDATAITVRTPHQPTPLNLHLQGLTLDIADLSTRTYATRTYATRTHATRTHAYAPATGLPALAARRIELAVARAEAQQPRQPQPFSTFVAKLQARLDTFSTREREAQPFALSFHDESGGAVRANGQLSLAGAQSRGEIAIERLSLVPVWRYFAQQLNGVMDSGALSIAGNFEADWRQALRYRATLRNADLHTVRAHARDDPDSRLDLGTLALRNARIDSSERRVQIESAAVDGLQLRGWNRGTRVSVLDLFKTEFAPSPANPVPGADARNADTSSTEAGWSLQLDGFALDNSRIDWRTDHLDPETLAFAPLKITAQSLYWPEQKPAAITLQTRVNDAAALTLQAALTPITQTGSVQGEIRGLPLAWGNRALAQQLSATISQGTLDTTFNAALENGSPQTLSGDGTIADFQLLRSNNKAQVAAWKQMAWRELAVDLRQRRLQLAQINFSKPQLLVRINPDGTTNLHELVVRSPAVAPSAAKENAEAEKVDTRPWQTAITQIHIDKGELNFRDNTLPRPFTALIGDFTGDIDGLSSAPDQFARVDLRGNVDGYAPVSLTGHIAPLRDKPALELALDFTNLDLATLTTYSGKYAGYAINRGLLTLQLAYKLEDSRLQGSNRIVITRLELGEKVESPKAVDLPLRLAIALLTDENGVIDLGVGVEGDLDNPEFSVRGIIWKALRNVIMKAVTSPFRLLGGLVGAADENLGVIDFAAGTDHIDAASRERLGKTVAALAQRPALKLRVIGHTSPAADGAAMRQGKLDYLLGVEGADAEDIQARNRDWEKAVVDVYEKTWPDRAVADRTPEQLALELRNGLSLGADAMGWLAGRRALAVKRVLVVELGLASDRVIIDAASGGPESGNRTQAELQVDH